jgi:hypothetical protein
MGGKLMWFEFVKVEVDLVVREVKYSLKQTKVDQIGDANPIT